MNKNRNYSIELFITFLVVSFICLFLASEYSKYKTTKEKKEYCSYYIGYSQNFLDLYLKRNETTELIEFIAEKQKLNPDLSLLNIYLAKRAIKEQDHSSIVIDIADICLKDKTNNFLFNIFKILKEGDLRKIL